VLLGRRAGRLALMLRRAPGESGKSGMSGTSGTSGRKLIKLHLLDSPLSVVWQTMEGSTLAAT
jgi:hypothetical protein